MKKSANSAVPKNWREMDSRGEAAVADAKYGEAQRAADAMPAARAQMVLYLDVGDLHMVRRIAEVESTSIQAIVREAVSTLVRARTRKTSKKPSKKKSSTKKER